MRVTLRNIAQQSQVSTATVSRVLSSRKDLLISEDTRHRVLSVAREMGYRPNRAARALVTGRSHVIAMWISTTYTPYYTEVMKHAHIQARQNGYEMVIRDIVPYDLSWKDDVFVSQWPLDGILAHEWPETVEAYLDAMGGSHPPLVSFGTYPTLRTDYVKIDYYPGARAATEHLIQSGCRRVAYFATDWGCRTGEARYHGYCDAINNAGLKPEFITMTLPARAPAREVIRDYVGRYGCPEALFCFSDEIAIGAYRGLCDLGIRVPDDIALVGCDGIEDTEYLECPLSTIAAPQEQLCARAWDFLQRRIDMPNSPLQSAVLPAPLIIRESSRR